VKIIYETTCSSDLTDDLTAIWEIRDAESGSVSLRSVMGGEELAKMNETARGVNRDAVMWRTFSALTEHVQKNEMHYLGKSLIGAESRQDR
jgi:hypothetical protein